MDTRAINNNLWTHGRDNSSATQKQTFTLLVPGLPSKKQQQKTHQLKATVDRAGWKSIWVEVQIFERHEVDLVSKRLNRLNSQNITCKIWWIKLFRSSIRAHNVINYDLT